MRKPRIRITSKQLVAAGLIVSCVLLNCETLLTQATSIQDIQTQLDDTQSKIDDTQSQIDDTQSKINAAQNNLNDINDEIMNLTDEQDLIEEMIADVQSEIQNTMTSIGMLEDEIAAKEEELVDKQAQIDQTQIAYEEAKATAEKQQDDMMNHIRVMYENGNTNYLALLLSGDSIADMLNRADFIEQVYEYDRNMLNRYVETQNQVQALWDQLENEKAQLENEKASLEDDKASLDEQKSSLNALLAQRQKESDDFEAEIRRARQEASVAKAQLQREQQELKNLQAQQRQQEADRARQEAELKDAQAAANNTGTGNSGNDNSTGNSGNTGSSETGSGNGTTNSSGGNSSNGSGGGSGSSGSSKGQEIADYACRFVGNPYKSGGTSLTDGADCSGFTYRVYMDFGYTLPRTSTEQRKAGVEVSYANAQPGDLICYDGHVALYIGNGKIVHASTAKTGIKISNANYRPILTVRRII